MNTQEFLENLNTHVTSRLRFILPKGKEIKGDLHITEVKSIHINSMDCGSNEYEYEETVIQLWNNEDSTKEANWLGSKAIQIFNEVQSRQKLYLESEAFIEYGDNVMPTSKYSIESIVKAQNDLMINLFVKPTECKPKALFDVTCC